MKYIDAHVHIVPETALGSVNQRFGGRITRCGYQEFPDGGGFHIMPPYVHDSQFTADTLVNMMDVYGEEKAVIQQSLLSPQNQVVAEAVEKYPQRLTGAMLIEPLDGWRDEMHRWRDRGLRSVKFEMRAFSSVYPAVGYDHPDMLAIFEEAARLDLTVTVDPAPTDFAVYRPDALRAAVSRFPELRFVLCHMAYPRPLETPEQRVRWEQMLQVAAEPNCWLDVSAMPDFFDDEGWPYPTALELLRKVKQEIGAEKLIWGSDIPATLCRATYPQMMRMFERNGVLTGAELEGLFRTNAEAAYRW